MVTKQETKFYGDKWTCFCGRVVIAHLIYTWVTIMKLVWDFHKHVQRKRRVLNLKPAMNVYFS
jgi:hypothetical protein